MTVEELDVKDLINMLSEAKEKVLNGYTSNDIATALELLGESISTLKSVEGSNYVNSVAEMKDEFSYLCDRINFAEKYYNSDECKQGNFMQRSYLMSQINCMKDYRLYLSKRLEYALNTKPTINI